MRMSPRLLSVVLVPLAAMPLAATACSGPESKSFQELLKSATSIAVVRVEAERLSKRTADPIFAAEVEASVRVVETLQGNAPTLELITYNATWCGGHRLDVGRYYVVLLQANSKTVSLAYEDRSVLGLGEEYSEVEKSAESRSLLLMNLRNFERIGQFPETFNVEPFLGLARIHYEWPSGTARR